MARPRRVILWTVLPAAFFALLIAACGGGDSVPGPSPQSVSKGQTTPAPSPSPAVVIHITLAVDASGRVVSVDKTGKMTPLVRLGCLSSNTSYGPPNTLFALQFGYFGPSVQLGSISLSFKSNPVPSSTASFQDNPLTVLNNYMTFARVQTSNQTTIGGPYDVVINANNHFSGSVNINSDFDWCIVVNNGTPGPSPTIGETVPPPTFPPSPTPAPPTAAERALATLATSLLNQPGSGLCGSECAQVVNNIAQMALGHTFVAAGDDTDWVPYINHGIIDNGYGTLLIAATTDGGAIQAQAGDIVIQDGYDVDTCPTCPGQAHIGICLNPGCTQVASNSNHGCKLVETNNTFSDNGYTYDANAVSAFYHIDH